MNPLKQSRSEFLRFIDKARLDTRRQSDACVDVEPERARIGSCLKALYEVSTCALGCRGGDHTIEYLAGRAFNLGYAAYDLCRAGLYDEAFNQIRSLGELANILALHLYDRESFNQWMEASDAERLKKFKPVQIRILIEEAGGVILVDKEAYAELCELATHISPRTVPNRHSEDLRPRVGGGYRSSGQKAVLDKLDGLLFCASTAFAKFSGHDDLFEALATLSESEA